jgi:hypothetical protein
MNADAGCCVAGQDCCAPGTGVDGCCGEDFTCCSNKAACCGTGFPECCAGTRFCCQDGDQCCSEANGAGCCPAGAPNCCPAPPGEIPYCCGPGFPVCAHSAADPDGYCCPPNSVGDGGTGCISTANHAQGAGRTLAVGSKRSRARGQEHEA